MSFNSLYFSLASIQLVLRLFCLHSHTSVSFKRRFHSHMCLLVLQKLSSAIFSLRIHSINHLKYVIQFRQSIPSNSAGCACKISALIRIPCIIPYTPVSNTANIDVLLFIGVLRFGITGNL